MKQDAKRFRLQTSAFTANFDSQAWRLSNCQYPFTGNRLSVKSAKNLCERRNREIGFLLSAWIR
ncbi:MAG TPA: hypothetical protein DDZ51_30175 [Planctomycetaceae bacterium]|nr:hypothetical protein [Planctomycetaceae bacterium]